MCSECQDPEGQTGWLPAVAPQAPHRWPCLLGRLCSSLRTLVGHYQASLSLHQGLPDAASDKEECDPFRPFRSRQVINEPLHGDSQRSRALKSVCSLGSHGNSIGCHCPISQGRAWLRESGVHQGHPVGLQCGHVSPLLTQKPHCVFPEPSVLPLC